jgi:hypothetical protein|nr:MAG TPA: distal tail protein [Caudoviricetes sp.]
MAFWGDYFVYDGIPCTEFGLRLYEVNGVTPGEAKFSVASDISEDRVSSRYRPLFYGVTQNEPLSFKMVFGADKELANSGGFFDAWDREAISSWLSPLDGYKWLEIEQDDMEQVRYRCIIEELEMVEIGNLPIAFSCTVRCDSPFAYQYPVTYSYTCQGNTNILLRNLGSYRGGYQPKLKITTNGTDSIKIINHSDNDRTFEFTGLPQSYFLEIEVDNENGVITNNMDLNLYPYFNFEFFKLICGDNSLEVVGDCKLEITCEFPVSVGG